MNEQNLNTTLNQVVANIVQLRQKRKEEALKCWEPIVKEILEYVKKKDHRFSAIRILHTGSYYERAKVKEPDEFDLMLVMDNLELDDAPFEEDDGFSEPPIGKIRPAQTLAFCEQDLTRIWTESNSKRCASSTVLGNRRKRYYDSAYGLEKAEFGV